MAIELKYNKITALRIRDFLLSQGLTVAGVYGMMANLYAKSGFRSNNVQNSCMTKLGMTDEEYTTKVDNRTYKNFITDRVGFGICQWTSSGRKEALLDYSIACRCSIGNETMQLKFLMRELSTSYKTVLNKLKTCNDISECSKYVMTKFERPADQSANTQNKRASYGTQLYMELEQNERGENIMSNTNSPLVDYIRISPNKTSPRNHKIDTISIHCYVGEVTAAQGCNGSRFVKYNRITGASCNYVVGYDGSIGLCVEEKDRSWCTSNKPNDHRAITIEVACEKVHPYKVTDKAMDALIKLCADICKRNDIKKLVWSTNKKDRVNHLNGCNMTVHRDYKNKACPGQYLYDRHGYIANEVNKLLGVKTEVNKPSSEKTKVTYITHRIPNNKWGSEITGYNLVDSMGYSGSFGKEIDKIAIKLSEGSITYCTHRLNGNWGSEITGYSTTDTSKYAGSTNKPIDAITIKANGINGKLKYRVHRTDGKWGGWITGYSKTDTKNYAGSFGKPIDAIQIGIE